MPLWQLLGGRARETLQISRVISMGEPTAMAAAAKRHVADGFRTVKVKVGDAANPCSMPAGSRPCARRLVLRSRSRSM